MGCIHYKPLIHVTAFTGVVIFQTIASLLIKAGVLINPAAPSAINTNEFTRPH